MREKDECTQQKPTKALQAEFNTKNYMLYVHSCNDGPLGLSVFKIKDQSWHQPKCRDWESVIDYHTIPLLFRNDKKTLVLDAMQVGWLIGSSSDYTFFDTIEECRTKVLDILEKHFSNKDLDTLTTSRHLLYDLVNDRILGRFISMSYSLEDSDTYYGNIVWCAHSNVFSTPVFTVYNPSQVVASSKSLPKLLETAEMLDAPNPFE